MTTTDIDLNEFNPVVQKKKAQDMMCESENKLAKIQFVLSTKSGVTPCQWIDPFMGFFQVLGEPGMICIDDLPEGSMIIGQQFVEIGKESPCLYCNSMGNRCPDDPMCDVYTQYKEKVKK